jgi:hypothetical protein
MATSTACSGHAPRNASGRRRRGPDRSFGVDREVVRLTEAIATGGRLAPLLDALELRQSRREVLTTTLAGLQDFERQ